MQLETSYLQLMLYAVQRVQSDQREWDGLNKIILAFEFVYINTERDVETGVRRQPVERMSSLVLRGFSQFLHSNPEAIL
jgi:hypothetical protein